MSTALEAFSRSYAAARSKFLDAATCAGGFCTTHIEPGLGAEGETLAMDVVRAGPACAKRVVIVTSACHGVEGYAGSAVQTGILRDRALLQALEVNDVALLLIHALNPHGFSHTRRWTAENVDLNRNAVDFNQPLPPNEPYRDLNELLIPRAWPPSEAHANRLSEVIAQQGMQRFQATVTKGQYEFSNGIFFGGHAPTWSLLTLRFALRKWIPAIQHAAWIDIHTGLGPSGVGEAIFTGGGVAVAHTLARQWWGDVTQTSDGTATSAELTGTLAELMQAELGMRLLSSITIEFGTVPALQVLQALRADAWAHCTGAPHDTPRKLAAQMVREAFFVETPAWKEAVYEQGLAAIIAAIKGMGRLKR